MNEITKSRKVSTGELSGVRHDLKDHFSVLDELSAKLEEYYAIPTISAGQYSDYQGW